MKIRIELVGYLSRIGLPNGYRGGELDVANQISLGDALLSIGVDEHTPLFVSVNQKFATRDQVLQNGDVVKLIPPISGG